MFIVIRRRTIVMFVLLLVLGAGALFALPRAVVPVLAPAREERAVFVIDAGHGGEDGGAVSQGGVVESGINLAIAQRLDALLTFLGEETEMTRTEDVSIYSDGAETLRQKKVSDLKNRVEIVNGTPHALLVSIHQNSMPTAPRVRGAQVFYNAVEPGEALARQVQASLNAAVNKGGAKQHKPIAPTIYLMKHVNCPAILVECGFLSNAEETELLCSDAYQMRLTAAIAAGLLGTEETEARP